MRRKMLPCFGAMAGGIVSVYALYPGKGLILLFLAGVAVLGFSAKSVLSVSEDRRRATDSACDNSSGVTDAVRGKASGLLCIFAVFFLTGMALMYIAMGEKPVCEGVGVEIQGVVSEVSSKAEDKHDITVVTEEGRVLVAYYEKLGSPSDLAGRMVIVRGDAAEIKPATNPGCFDYRLYLKTKKIFTKITAEEIEIYNVEDHFSNMLACIRDGFKQDMKMVMKEDEAEILCAMMFGDKSTLDEDVYESFQRNGTAHVLAVSGLHIGMIYAMLCVILGGRRKKGTNIAIAVILVAYMALAGFSPSVVRAVLMILMHIVSKLTHLRFDLVSAAGAAAVIMLVNNPFVLFGTGFQLSFLAVFIIGFFMKSVEKVRLPERVKGVVLPPLIIQAGMAPVTAYMFNYFSLGAVVANIPVIFLAGIIVPAGVLTMAAWILFPALSGYAAGVLGSMTGMMIEVNDFFYLGGKSSFDIASPRLTVIFLVYALGFYVFSEWARIIWTRGERRRWFAAVACLVVLCLAAGSRFGNDFLSCQCVFVDVGQGACVHLRTEGGRNYLFDGGGKPVFGEKKTISGTNKAASDGGTNKAGAEKNQNEGFDVGKKILRPYLLKNGAVKVDIAFVSHLDADHYLGIASVCRLGMVKKLGLHECLKSEEAKVIRETGMNKKDILYFRTGDTIKESGFRMDILGPLDPDSGGTGQSTSDNENSMVGRAVFRKDSVFGDEQEVSVLITGDIDEKAEGELVSAYTRGELKCDIIAAPHHGSRYSSSQAIINAVEPAATVIQVGKNHYGHPSSEVIERYEEAGVQVFRNDTQGAIGVCGRKIKTGSHSHIR